MYNWTRFNEKIPEFNDKITTLEKTINEMSNDIIKRFNQLKETISSNEQDYKTINSLEVNTNAEDHENSQIITVRKQLNR
jgi:septal ring factor EnvC (AmiA/AmiB activator)